MPTLDASNIQSASLELPEPAVVEQFKNNSTSEGSGQPYQEARKRSEDKIRPRKQLRNAWGKAGDSEI